MPEGRAGVVSVKSPSSSTSAGPVVTSPTVRVTVASGSAVPVTGTATVVSPSGNGMKSPSPGVSMTTWSTPATETVKSDVSLPAGVPATVCVTVTV